jgi:putative membrane protein insertion efficiency factor
MTDPPDDPPRLPRAVPPRGGGPGDSSCGDLDCCPFDGCDLSLLALLGNVLITTCRHTRSARPDPGLAVPRGRSARLLFAAVMVYRIQISPTRPPCCRYTPTCSTYAAIALHRHGALRGSGLTVARLLRCRPGHDGHDPVPPRAP